MPEPDQQLKYLSKVNFGLAIILAIGATFGISQIFVGMMVLVVGLESEETSTLAAGSIYSVWSILIVVAFTLLSIGSFVSARKLANGEHHRICTVVAGLQIWLLGFWSLWGIYTIIVLNRRGHSS